MSAQYTIALAGNPNAGKSTVFNALTGARQHVGNWPGKTVEKKEGVWKHGGVEFEVVDLPGTYSLTAYSMEEIIARDYIVDGRPDVVVSVVDAANLERNLYLVVQILEMGARVVVALNMSDVADSRGLKIDLPKLSTGLGGIPVVPTVASKGQGIDQLKEAIINTINEEG
ncbi:MAG: FeoB small GTPase domain-containing protein [Chloroflexota bacterium]|nr:FeoB small GTPase domain-containing protein [Chloroflexota bacterium]